MPARGWAGGVAQRVSETRAKPGEEMKRGLGEADGRDATWLPVREGGARVPAGGL
ncbi:MAG TPA: hypothetical protein VH599_14785 [Ktedonobacterales bacterium]|jgi:hypothetical protein